MNQKLYDTYLQILRQELVPAMGCTEPISIAYAAAFVRKTLGCLPERIELGVSANIIKNTKSVVVPHTGGLTGIAAAVAAGIVAGDADAKLEVLSHVEPQQIHDIALYLKNTPIHISSVDAGSVFEIRLRASADTHYAFVRIAGHHTNIVEIVRDNVTILSNPLAVAEQSDHARIDYKALCVKNIIDFALCVRSEEIKPVLEQQIVLNTAIAREGLKAGWGAEIGRVLLSANGDNVHNRARAMAAAGSDARMSGCELPVVINSGSGNQGITASLPVIVYAQDMNASEDTLMRALAVSNLVTIHLKTGIGCLSAYCGATSAGCGAGAGISYLHGGRLYEISHTIVNALAIASGMICDGAKPSCAAKISTAVECGLLGWQMQMLGKQFYGGDGIVTKGVENTINNISHIARVGMAVTDQEIIRIMVEGGKPDDDTH